MNKKIISYALAIFAALGAVNVHAATFTVGGTVTGLASGKTVVLKNNTNTVLVSSTAPSFTFPAQNAGTSWNVSVAIQPSGQTCTVANASGTNISANVTNVAVTCSNTYTVGGTVSGLIGSTLVLRNGSISLVVNSGATTFKFAAGLKNATAYNVLAAIQPPGFSCVVSNGLGVINNANVGNVAITCVRTYTVSGTVSGLTASGLTLRLTYTPLSGSSVSINKVVPAGATSFAFSNGIKAGSTYQVDVITQPNTQTCLVTNGTGTISTSNVTNVAVICRTNDPSLIWDNGQWDSSVWN